MPNGRKPGERAAGVPRGPRVPYTPEQKESRRKKRDQTRAEKSPGWLPHGDAEKVHVAKIMTPDPLIFPPKLYRALQLYLDTIPRDAVRAATGAQMDVAEFKEHLHSPGVRDWLKTQQEQIDQKIADLRARARVLTEDHLDAATLDVLESKDTPAPQKVRMIEVGYRRFGMLKDKAEVTGNGGAPLAFQLVRIQGRKDDDVDAGS